jgi:hypothetical protein
MKLPVVILTAVVANALAQPHHHAHRHNQVVKRGPSETGVYVPAPIATVVVYELNGHSIGEDEVRQGITNGTLAWGDDGVLSTSVAVSAAKPTLPPKPAADQENKPPPVDKPSVNQPSAQPPAKTPELKAPSKEPKSKAQSKAPESKAPESKAPESKAPAPMLAPQPDNSRLSAPKDYSPIDKDGHCADCDIEFRNNFYPCSRFPTGYGAISLGNEGLGGWSGIQDPKERGAAGYDDIRTTVKGSCDDGACCTKGAFCSYACPNPYLKMSFPKKQGRTGQSVGGLYCNNNGRLEMADGSLSKTLCGKGSSHFKVKVQNKLSKSVSICRTDYPGKYLEHTTVCYSDKK